MTQFSLSKMICIVLLFCAAAVIASPAQSVFFTRLYSFCSQPNCADGFDPYGGLVQATDGNFYGMTGEGGANDYGTVFKITSAGVLTTLHRFDDTDGSEPEDGLVQATDGNFYGTTHGGGTYGGGTVFKIAPAGTLTTLYSFCSQPNCTDGDAPWAGLVQATDGNFYGTALIGGAYGNGTVFKITPGGVLTTLHSFDGSDGFYPTAGLVQATDGNFYGTINEGGAYGVGTVFKITPGGVLTTLHSFDGPDGAGPFAALVQATDGNFYGTTEGGGANGNYGTVFKITSAGVLTTLHSFDDTDGSEPEAGLVQATDGNFYGTTYWGGAGRNCFGGGCGTVFKITPEGRLSTLYSFCTLGWPCADGYALEAGLVQATDGNFYGTAVAGGTYGYGTVFRLGVVRACTTCRP